jgi:hypothetical protein
MDFIFCPICGKKLKEINDSHLKIHKLTIKQFDELYPTSIRFIKNDENRLSRYQAFNFNNLNVVRSLSREEVVSILEKDVLDEKGRIKKIFSKDYYIRKNNLIEFLENVLYYTSFLKSGAGIVERLHCLYNNINTYPKCEICENRLMKFKGHFNNGSFGKFYSSKCNRMANNPHDFMSEETRCLKAKKLSEARTGVRFNQRWKNKLKVAANREEVKEKKKKACLELYGVENPGVLGAFSSKSAREYIITFLEENGICKNRCYFKDVDTGKKEFFQMVYVPFLKKKKYFCYDLVVFKDEEAYKSKNIKEIELVLEYNGPWHYEEHEVSGHEEEPSMPYKTCKHTKKQTYELDKIKMDHICNYANSVTVFNEKTGKFVFIK